VAVAVPSSPMKRIQEFSKVALRPSYGVWVRLGDEAFRGEKFQEGIWGTKSPES